MHIQGKPHSVFLCPGGSKRQGCVSHSTPEAEIVAADVTLRTMGFARNEHLGNADGKVAQIIVS